MWKVVLTQLQPSIRLTRTLHSRTGVWPASLNTDTKFEIERYWKDKVHNFSKRNGENKYVLAMFPYPSGNLHLGHIRVYTIGDVIARYQGMRGKNVIFPIGWDSFGLPAENAAIERGENPRIWTANNIQTMKKQLQDFNFCFNWEREISTSDPSYYKWTQYLFVKLFEKGLLYQKEAVVNWDPVDNTTVADEQVDAQGKSWRSGALVEKKILKQWYIRATEYTEDLYKGLDNLEGWEDITGRQKGWIGDINEGVIFHLELNSSSLEEKEIDVWTDRPELLFGAAYIVVSKVHRLAHILEKNKNSVTAVNPLNGKRMPIFLDDGDFEIPKSTQCFLGVPCNSEAEAEFAQKQKIDYVDVSQGENVVNTGQFDGPCSEAREKVLEFAQLNNFGGSKCSKFLRDWLISRQRYWGTPIPVIHCVSCGPVAVSEKDLPVTLPELKQGLKLSEATDWLKVPCPKCGSAARRDADTMDTFVDSSWYYLRYLDPKNTESLADRTKVKEMMPVDFYIGGAEHAVMHLYYARFMAYFMHKELGLGNENFVEPFKKMIVQGMVLNETFNVASSGKYIPKNQVDLSNPKKLTEISTGAPVVVKWDKMSKSKHNGILPEDLTAKYGIDATRLFILAGFAPTSPYRWPSPMFDGILSWQSKIWNSLDNFRKCRDNTPEELNEEWEKRIRQARNDYIHKVNYHMESTHHFNLVVKLMQIFTKELRHGVLGHGKYFGPEFERGLGDLLITMAPFCPHFVCEMWAGFLEKAKYGYFDKQNVFEEKWPKLDADFRLHLNLMAGEEVLVHSSVSQDELKTLTLDDAVKILGDQIPEELRELEPSFIVYPSFKAVLMYPSMKEKVETELTKKKKFKKKKNKQSL